LGGANQSNVTFAREAHDWEVDAVAYFLQALHSARAGRDREDKLWWVPSKKSLFKVKSFFCSLACFGGSRFPWKSVWCSQAPSSVAFFAWSTVLGKILTLDSLRKRHVIVIDICYMCKKTGESVDYLIHCDVTYTLCSYLLSCFGLSWVMPIRIIDLLVGGPLEGRGVPQCGK